MEIGKFKVALQTAVEASANRQRTECQSNKDAAQTVLVDTTKVLDIALGVVGGSTSSPQYAVTDGWHCLKEDSSVYIDFHIGNLRGEKLTITLSYDRTIDPPVKVTGLDREATEALSFQPMTPPRGMRATVPDRLDPEVLLRDDDASLLADVIAALLLRFYG